MAAGRISPSDDARLELARITAALGEVGFALPGSVAVRSYRCGKTGCACHADPPRLHGPYVQWTRRIGPRTVHTNLTPEQYEDYQAFFDNAARLRAIVNDLEALTLAVVSADPRLKQPGSGPAQMG
jgi:hypothetical protein